MPLLRQALVFPHNLGEGKLEGQKDNDIYYLLGVCLRKLGDETAAHSAFEKAAEGDSTPAGAMYYNDQPADMILYRGLAHEALGCHSEALKCFHQLVDYGETHLFDECVLTTLPYRFPNFSFLKKTSPHAINCIAAF